MLIRPFRLAVLHHLRTHIKQLDYYDRIQVEVEDQLHASCVLQKVHEGHQGIEWCRLRAHSSVRWPNFSKQIKDLVQNCLECAKLSRNRREALMVTPLPDYQWKVVSTDLFDLDQFLLVVDYYSRYPEVIRLQCTASAVIKSLKSNFS